jgi:hypothetical protein
MNKKKRLLSPEEVEEEFGISRRWQEDLRAQRLIPYHKFQRGKSARVLYDIQDVEDFLVRTKVPAAS